MKRSVRKSGRVLLVMINLMEGVIRLKLCTVRSSNGEPEGVSARYEERQVQARAPPDGLGDVGA